MLCELSLFILGYVILLSLLGPYVSHVSNLRPYFLTMCELFPDANKAALIPLPKVEMDEEST